MAQVTEAQILDALRAVRDPDQDQDIVSLGIVTGLVIKDGNIGFAIEVDPKRGPHLEPMRKAAEDAVDKVPGVLSVTAVLTAHSGGGGKTAPAPQQQAPQKARPQVQSSTGGARELAPGVKAIVAVASGKGGVGKSTTAINLAMALSASGLSVGILDADIYGPSLPRMMGISDKPTSEDGRILIPLEKHGVKCMSIGFLVPEDSPTIWRGPMVMSALEQMLRDVAWGELDVMIVDMPPGTGDAQLTMSQRVPLAGAVIVSTPQDIALLDARKGLNMFRKVDVPVLGIIENMSTFICPHCGGQSDIFGHGGARAEAAALEVDFLGEVPLHMEIRKTSDAGTPIVVSTPDGPHALAYRGIADAVWAKVAPSGDGNRRAAPRIVMN
ncbi:MAG: iron-sulfur cluster carrier protein ApbC [Alphaproteobacteria bacterium]|jgi:ATP-binding protein involved in chromosome partitioning|nr:iron-sulfur cluster carrier protein ApbC [Alphaproteobacteria bacterium]